MATLQGAISIADVADGIQGLTGATGAAGADGDAGSDGTSVAPVFAYKWGTAVATDKPATTRTYTFATGAWNNTDGGNSWTLGAIPTKGTNTHLSVCIAVAASTGTTDTVAAADWSAAQLTNEDGAQGAAGNDGVNTAPLYAYKWGTAIATNKPSTTRTYTFATGAWNNTDGGNGWTLGSVPTKGSNTHLSVSNAIASGTGATDSVVAADWSTAVLITQDGADGANGNDGNDGNDGNNGSPAPRLTTIPVYRANSDANAPSAPSANLTWANSAVNALTSGWQRNAPTVPGTGDPYYSSNIVFSDNTGAAASTNATGNTPTASFTFSGLVTFNSANVITDGTTTTNLNTVANNAIANNTTVNTAVTNNNTTINTAVTNNTIGNIDIATNNTNVGSGNGNGNSNLNNANVSIGGTQITSGVIANARFDSANVSLQGNDGALFSSSTVIDGGQITTGLISTQYLFVDSALSLTGPNSGFLAGRSSLSDFGTDGFYIGRSSTDGNTADGFQLSHTSVTGSDTIGIAAPFSVSSADTGTLNGVNVDPGSRYRIRSVTDGVAVNFTSIGGPSIPSSGGAAFIGTEFTATGDGSSVTNASFVGVTLLEAGPLSSGTVQAIIHDDRQGLRIYEPIFYQKGNVDPNGDSILTASGNLTLAAGDIHTITLQGGGGGGGGGSQAANSSGATNSTNSLAGNAGSTTNATLSGYSSGSYNGNNTFSAAGGAGGQPGLSATSSGSTGGTGIASSFGDGGAGGTASGNTAANAGSAPANTSYGAGGGGGGGPSRDFGFNNNANASFTSGLGGQGGEKGLETSYTIDLTNSNTDATLAVTVGAGGTGGTGASGGSGGAGRQGTGAVSDVLDGYTPLSIAEVGAVAAYVPIAQQTWSARYRFGSNITAIFSAAVGDTFSTVFATSTSFGHNLSQGGNGTFSSGRVNVAGNITFSGSVSGASNTGYSATGVIVQWRQGG